EAVFALADRITVLVYGRIIASGTPEAIRANAEGRQAYLGEKEQRHGWWLAVRGVEHRDLLRRESGAVRYVAWRRGGSDGEAVELQGHAQNPNGECEKGAT